MRDKTLTKEYYLNNLGFSELRDYEDYLIVGKDAVEILFLSLLAEGKLLYKSEMASWYGTDLFIKNYKNQLML